MSKVLIVGDDTDATRSLGEFIRGEGFAFDLIKRIDDVPQQLSLAPPTLLLVNQQSPDSAELDSVIEMAPPDTQVVVITPNPEVEHAIDSLRAQVFDYLVEPLDMQRLRKILHSLPARWTKEDPLAPLVGESTAMQQLREMITKVAPTQASVLLLGDSGSGKELVARAIHDLSERCEGPYLSVNCGAVSSTLIGSQLFGHERGSFTGAERRHMGFFERAAGGTLFLDEITEMPPELQIQLLRVLETNRLTRLGGQHEIELDVRLLAATNRSPEQAIEEGKLREDLYFRLAVFPLLLPSLRERQDDIIPLSEHFLSELNFQEGANKRLSKEAQALLQQRDWPGNIRELKNAIQRAFILADDTIGVAHFPTTQIERHDPDEGKLRVQVGTPIKDAERELILSTLEQLDGDKPRVAETLGVSLKTLYNRLSEYQDDETDTQPTDTPDNQGADQRS